MGIFTRGKLPCIDPIWLFTPTKLSHQITVCIPYWSFFRNKVATNIIKCFLSHLVYNTCSAIFDNLLVEVDILYHFRGLIFLNAKILQFNLYKIIKKAVSQSSKSSIQLHLPLKCLWRCWFCYRHTKKLIMMTPLSFLMGSG